MRTWIASTLRIPMGILHVWALWLTDHAYYIHFWLNLRLSSHTLSDFYVDSTAKYRSDYCENKVHTLTGSKFLSKFSRVWWYASTHSIFWFPGPVNGGTFSQSGKHMALQQISFFTRGEELCTLYGQSTELLFDLRRERVSRISSVCRWAPTTR